MTKGCSLLLLCELVVYFRISKHPFSFYGCFLKSDFERMHFRCRFCFFQSGSCDRNQRTGPRQQGKPVLSHCGMSSYASVVEHPKLLSILSFFFLIRSHFPALHASIGLDIVNLSIELSCVVTVVPFPHQVVVQRCMMGCFSLHQCDLCGPVPAGRLGLYWFLLVSFLFNYDLTYELCNDIRKTVWNSLRLIPDRNMPMTECV